MSIKVWRDIGDTEGVDGVSADCWHQVEVSTAWVEVSTAFGGSRWSCEVSEVWRVLIEVLAWCDGVTESLDRVQAKEDDWKSVSG